MSVFETIGLGLITNLLSDLVKKIKIPKRKTETQIISERLQYILKLMNESREEKFTVAEFSKLLKLKKVGELEKYFLNQEESSFKFLKKFTKEFAINLEWLTEGKGHPFKYDQDNYICLYEDALKRIEELEPSIIYFIRSDSINGELCLMLKIEEHRFIVLNTYVHFSVQNDSNERKSLIDLRKLIMSVILEKRIMTKGVIIPNKVFKDLYRGKIFPSTSLSLKKGRFDYWHDDFTDIYNERYGYQRHKNYDQNFQDAFKIVKNYIEKDRNSNS